MDAPDLGSLREYVDRELAAERDHLRRELARRDTDLTLIQAELESLRRKDMAATKPMATTSHASRRQFLTAGLAAVGGAAAVGAGVALAGQGTARADAPSVVNYQGRLTDATGAPLSGTYNMSFALYNAATGGTVQWGPEQHTVQVNNGLFSVFLGSGGSGGIPTSILGQTLWLGVSVGADPEMTPREQLGTVPYALNASALNGFPASTSATANSVPVLSSAGRLPAGAAIGVYTATSNSVATTTSTSFVNVDDSWSLTATISGSMQLILVSISSMSNEGENTYFSLNLTVGSGTPTPVESGNILAAAGWGNGIMAAQITYQWIPTPALSPGTYTFTPIWYTDGNTSMIATPGPTQIHRITLLDIA